MFAVERDGVEAEIDLVDPDKTADEQARADDRRRQTPAVLQPTLAGRAPSTIDRARPAHGARPTSGLDRRIIGTMPNNDFYMPGAGETEDQDSRIDASPVPEDSRRGNRLEDTYADLRQCDAESAARRQATRSLSSVAGAIRATAGAKGGADGDFLPTGLGLGEKQVRDRGARNEEDNRDGPEHDEQRAPGVTGHEIVQKNRIAVHPSVPQVGHKSLADPAVADLGEFIRDLMRIMNSCSAVQADREPHPPRFAGSTSIGSQASSGTSGAIVEQQLEAFRHDATDEAGRTAARANDLADDVGPGSNCRTQSPMPPSPGHLARRRQAGRYRARAAPAACRTGQR